ncbi:MAG: hypothetical protein JXQ96_16500 [Cyclobacteriaceae bacterium]
MRKKQLLPLGVFRFIIVLLVALWCSISVSQAQLLENRNKLKTEKATKKGFSLYKKKVVKRVPSGDVKTDDKQVSPKYSQNQESFRSKKRVSPKYSKRGRWKSIRAITPRYSQSTAGQGGDRAVSPKYSRPRRAGKVTIISPKYSRDVAGQGSDRAIIPKYSRDVAGQGSDRLVSPKYSRDIAGQGSDRIVNPKYSRFVAGQGSDRVVNPKYSRSIAGQGYDRVVSPKYSSDIAGQGSDRVVNPRYSQYVAGQGMDRVVKPRFSVNPLYQYKYKLPATASGSMVFEFPKKLYEKGRKRNANGESEWMGPEVVIIDHKRSEFADYTGKFKKQKKGKKMHPSANYLFAKYNNSRIARDAMQKASILWVRVHMNQTDPKGVKKKPSKLKFDKDEAEIWNNEEREYTKN